MKKNMIIRSARNSAGKALMVLSLVGMMGMSVSAAGGRELEDINNDVNVKKYDLKLNANGSIEYDRDLDKKKEVYYDYLDYQKLAESLSTVDKNEQELDKEYSRLYNLAESNRKDIINAWNTLGLSSIDINNGKYVTGSGTASIKGAIEALGTRASTVATSNEIRKDYSAVLPDKGWTVGTMPEHTFKELEVSFNDGKVSVKTPTPSYGYYSGDGTLVDTETVNKQIAAAMEHTETFKLTAANTNDWKNYLADMGASHKYRRVDWTDAYNKGKIDGDGEGYKRGLAEGGQCSMA